MSNHGKHKTFGASVCQVRIHQYLVSLAQLFLFSVYPLILTQNLSLSMSLLRHNGTLSKQKNEMVSVHQRLKATLDFFTASLHIDMYKYQEQRATGIGKTNTHTHTQNCT